MNVSAASPLGGPQHDHSELMGSLHSDSVEMLDLATRAANVGIWDLDVLSGHLHWTPICRRIFNVASDAPLTLQDFYDRLHADDLPRLNDLIQRCLSPALRVPYDAEFRIMVPGGGSRWAHATGKAFFQPVPASPDGEHRCVRFIGTIRDITDRKEAEERSVRAVETLALATSAADVGIWDVDPLNNAMHWDRICCSIFGVDPNVPLSMDDFYAGLHPEDRSRVRAQIERVVDSKIRQSYDVEYRVVRPGGEVRWGHATGKAFFEPVPNSSRGDSRCVRFIGTIRDITERRRSTDALIQAEKLAATGRLAASIAHEINNPLEAVTNILYLLRTCADEAERQHYLRLAEEEISRVTEITTQTLRFYRDPSGPAACDIATVIDSVITLFHGRLNLLGISLKVSLAPNCIVLGSLGELRQVVVNLVGNSLDAMPSGGTLHLRCRTVRHPSSGEPTVAVVIADTGEGMAPETAHRIFQPFFTTKEATGTGLGLWLSLEILKKHHAGIRVRSQLGKGTATILFVPAVRPA